MTQDEKCCKVSTDGWWVFCIYFEACRHRTATAAKDAIKETILEHGSPRAIESGGSLASSDTLSPARGRP